MVQHSYFYGPLSYNFVKYSPPGALSSSHTVLILCSVVLFFHYLHPLFFHFVCARENIVYSPPSPPVSRPLRLAVHPTKRPTSRTIAFGTPPSFQLRCMNPGIQPPASDVVAIVHSIMAGFSVLAELPPFPDRCLSGGVTG